MPTMFSSIFSCPDKWKIIPVHQKCTKKKYFMLLNITVQKSDQESIWVSGVWFLGGSRSVAIKWHTHVFRSCVLWPVL